VTSLSTQNVAAVGHGLHLTRVANVEPLGGLARTLTVVRHGVRRLDWTEGQRVFLAFWGSKHHVEVWNFWLPVGEELLCVGMELRICRDAVHTTIFFGSVQVLPQLDSLKDVILEFCASTTVLYHRLDLVEKLSRKGSVVGTGGC